MAGNVFDWGAKEVALLMESKDGLKFEDALAFVKPRPWLVDHLDEWKERLRQKKPHKCAAIFIDNSGFDVILGIFPFVVEMLRLVHTCLKYVVVYSEREKLDFYKIKIEHLFVYVLTYFFSQTWNEHNAMRQSPTNS